nr:unnamed protein product [Spirometra erinaceieuropaei]
MEELAATATSYLRTLLELDAQKESIAKDMLYCLHERQTKSLSPLVLSLDVQQVSQDKARFRLTTFEKTVLQLETELEEKMSEQEKRVTLLAKENSDRINCLSALREKADLMEWLLHVKVEEDASGRIDDVLCRGTKYVISYLQRCFERKRKLKGDNETFDSDAVEKDSSVSKHVFQAEAQELDGGDRENTDTCQNPAKPDRALCPSGDCDTFETMLDDLAIAWVDESLAQSESPIADRSARLLHKAKAYRRVKKQYFDRKRRGQSGFCRNSWSALPTQSQRHMYLLGDYPEPLTLDQLLTTQKEQKARLKRQAAMIRMDEIVQKAKQHLGPQINESVYFFELAVINRDEGLLLVNDAAKERFAFKVLNDRRTDLTMSFTQDIAFPKLS